MNLNNQNFPEARLSNDFAKDKLKEFKQLIDRGLSYVAMSMPGVGASYFLKYLACQDFAYFIHIDLYSLPSLHIHEFYKLLLSELGGNPSHKSNDILFLESKKRLKEISQKEKKVVIIFNRFDQLKHEFDSHFLSNLQSLIGEDAGKIVLIFTAIKPLSDLVPEAIVGGNLTFYSRHHYFQPYSENDLKMLLKIDHEPTPNTATLHELIKLSGGHYQLLKIMLNSHKQPNLILDQFVKLQMKGLLDYLGYGQRKQIQKIALGRKIEDIDEYLIGVGMVKKESSGYSLFTPLLAQYVKQTLVPKLPPREAKLFRLLKENLGKTVSKDEIFNTVWEENVENATNWALDALIYRLRKHPFIHAGGYIIESYKKIGYILMQA